MANSYCLPLVKQEEEPELLIKVPELFFVKSELVDFNEEIRNESETVDSLASDESIINKKIAVNNDSDVALEKPEKNAVVEMKDLIAPDPIIASSKAKNSQCKKKRIKKKKCVFCGSLFNRNYLYQHIKIFHPMAFVVPIDGQENM